MASWARVRWYFVVMIMMQHMIRADRESAWIHSGITQTHWDWIWAGDGWSRGWYVVWIIGNERPKPAKTAWNQKNSTVGLDSRVHILFAVYLIISLSLSPSHARSPFTSVRSPTVFAALRRHLSPTCRADRLGSWSKSQLPERHATLPHTELCLHRF